MEYLVTNLWLLAYPSMVNGQRSTVIGHLLTVNGVSGFDGWIVWKIGEAKILGMFKN